MEQPTRIRDERAWRLGIGLIVGTWSLALFGYVGITILEHFESRFWLPLSPEFRDITWGFHPLPQWYTILDATLALMFLIGVIIGLLALPYCIYLTSKTKLSDTAKYDERSGKGKLSVVPPEILGWNWGAAGLGVIWGICYNVWWSFIAWIPFVNFFWWIVMGMKGNEWAWRSKRWVSVEDFKRTQGGQVSTIGLWVFVVQTTLVVLKALKIF